LFAERRPHDASLRVVFGNFNRELSEANRVRSLMRAIA